MPKNVYVNVIGHRLIDNGSVVEDITSVSQPTLEHPTTSITKVSGMAADVDIPNRARLNAMELTINHNNGRNCRYLSTPGRHNLEFRTVRQNYVVSEGDAKNESVKWRYICDHKSSEKGNIEMGNPYGSTEKYSVLRYEEEINGEVVTIVDAMSGILRWNGVDVTDEIEGMMN